MNLHGWGLSGFLPMEGIHILILSLVEMPVAEQIGRFGHITN